MCLSMAGVLELWGPFQPRSFYDPVIYLQLSFFVISTVIKPHALETLPVSLSSMVLFCNIQHYLKNESGLLKIPNFYIVFSEKNKQCLTRHRVSEKGASWESERRELGVMGKGPAEAGMGYDWEWHVTKPPLEFRWNREIFY